MPGSECKKLVNIRPLVEGNSSSDRDGGGSFTEEAGFKQNREERKAIPGWCV